MLPNWGSKSEFIFGVSSRGAPLAAYFIFWGLLGPSWGLLGPSWSHLGAFWGHFWAILGPLASILGLLCCTIPGPAECAKRLNNMDQGRKNSKVSELDNARRNRRCYWQWAHWNHVLIDTPTHLILAYQCQTFAELATRDLKQELCHNSTFSRRRMKWIINWFDMYPDGEFQRASKQKRFW